MSNTFVQFMNEALSVRLGSPSIVILEYMLAGEVVGHT